MMFDDPKEKEKPKPKAKRRVLKEEDFNREGHWTRCFTVRQEIWPIIEHWASENAFRLVAMKGKKRAYEKSVGAGRYKVRLEMKQVESEFTLVAWIQVGLSARAMYLFFHPRELPIEATGYKGSVVRRKTCSELNQLLERLKQPAIADSLGFHIADLDSTTRVLGALMILPIVYFILGTARQIDPNAAVTKEVFALASRPFGILTLVGVIFMLLHNFVVIKKWNRKVVKNVSAGAFFLIFAVTSAVLFSQANGKMERTKFLTYCFNKANDPKCDTLKSRLSEKDREWLLQRMDELQKELSIKPK